MFFDDHPIYSKQLEEEEKLEPQLKELLKKVRSRENRDLYQLNVIKRKRPKLKKGDVFLVNLYKNVYFYGLVLSTDFSAPVFGKNLVDICIFKDCTYSIEENAEIPPLKKENILLIPSMVSRSYWYNGFFYNIGNIGEENIFEYALFYMSKGIFVDGNREPVKELPDILGSHSLLTDIGVAGNLYSDIFVKLQLLTPKARNLFFEHIEELINGEPQEIELTEFDKAILPFEFYKEHAKRYSMILCEFEEFENYFFDRSEELTGSGCDWEDLMKYFVKINFPESKKKFHYDSEADMFYMYCSDENLMKAVVLKIKQTIDDGKLSDYIMEAKFSDL